MVFGKEDQAVVDSWLTDLRRTRQKIERTKFGDIADYCVARHEETIKLFLEMSKFIEDNLDIFYNPDWKWFQSNKCSHLARMNEYNSVLGYSSEPEYISIWIPMGIKFFYSLKQKRVLWVTHERDVEDERNTSPDMECVKYRFFHFWDGGKYPSFGYERYAKTPAFETYFGELPKSPFGYFALKDWVDADWKNANICKTCLKDAISSILGQDKETLDHIVGMKADIKTTRENEGF